jgi:hypothetical protein
MPRKPLQADSTYHVMLMLQATMKDGSKATKGHTRTSTYRGNADNRKNAKDWRT